MIETLAEIGGVLVAVAIAVAAGYSFVRPRDEEEVAVLESKKNTRRAPSGAHRGRRRA